MNVNLEVRLKQLESLEQYISSSRDKVQSILDYFKWTEEKLFKEQQLITCSVDPSHRIHLKGVQDHIEKCALQREGYEVNEDFLSEPLHDKKSSVMIDDHKKMEILLTACKNTPGFKTGWNGQDPNPKTADRLPCTFSSDERLALYAYAVANTEGPPKLPEFNTLQPIKDDTKPLTYAELCSMQRDAKRRRIKHKSVHTNHKNHKEVLREVIEGQMESYTDWLIDNGFLKSDKDNTSTDNSNNVYDHQKNSSSTSTTFERSQSVVSKNSTYSGSSRNTATKDSYKNFRSDNRRHNHSYRVSDRRDSTHKRRRDRKDRDDSKHRCSNSRYH